ncbi:sensor histidine kinase [Roseivirga misakiensis]|uniref:Signal transduction histidine kinase internal region domain-containing protein n=1 Tax=Roseivirga misakiensis TaxID=1563681 RepID=A0A1E5SXX4_9BACT|nr:histidine kinase [Roseivirga misakiensis]OEK03965.1 hypothetical protein BFP71_10715 [Roseivirga misakiensis]
MRVSKEYIKWLHIGFWLVLFLFPFSLGLQQESVLPVLNRILLPYFLQIAIAYLNIYVLVPTFFKTKKYGFFLLSVLAILLLMSQFIIGWFNFTETDLLRARTVPGSDLTIQELPGVIRAFPPMLFTLLIVFISTIYALGKDQLEKEQTNTLLEKEKAQAELKFLRSQINPHFFLNALNNLYSVLKLKPEKTDQFIRRLSEMLHYVTYESNKGKIKLSREIEIIDSYVFFQLIKDEESIDVDLDLKIADDSVEIEPMIVLPLLENAFKHGYSVTGENLSVKISVVNQDQSTEITITNSIPSSQSRPNTNPSESGIGLTNIEQRLKYCYGEKHSFTTQKTATEFIAKLSLTHGI